MSATTPTEPDIDDADDAPIETLRELEAEWKTLAKTDLPIAPYARNALDRLAEAETDE